MSLSWELQSVIAWEGVPLVAAPASTGTAKDSAQTSASEVIARRIIGDKLMGKPAIQPHQSLVVAVLAEPLAGALRARALRARPAAWGSCQSSRQRAAQAAPSVAGSVASSPTSSGSPPRSEASTGTPAASASSTEYGHGSSQREGASTTAARRRRSASVEGSSGRRSGRRRRSPSPAHADAARPDRRRRSRAAAPAALAAAIAVSNPFSSVRRPAASANSPSPARESDESS